METLRKYFAGLGFTGVETFIASGNVIVDAPSTATRELEERIAMELERRLGYPVATFVRSPAELSRVASHRPFDATSFDYDKHSLYIGFLPDAPAKNVMQKVVALRTPMDELHIKGRQLYWGRRGRFSGTELSGGALERALGCQMTVRSVTTVRKLAAKYG